MPRVVCSTTEWVLTKRLSEIISKKGCQESGIPLVLPNRLSEIIQTVAQMIGITLLDYGCLAFTYIIDTAPTVILASSAPMVITSLSVKIRANAYRNQSLNDSSCSTFSCGDVLATVPVIYI